MPLLLSQGKARSTLALELKDNFSPNPSLASQLLVKFVRRDVSAFLSLHLSPRPVIMGQQEVTQSHLPSVGDGALLPLKLWDMSDSA